MYTSEVMKNCDKICPVKKKKEQHCIRHDFTLLKGLQQIVKWFKIYRL